MASAQQRPPCHKLALTSESSAALVSSVSTASQPVGGRAQGRAQTQGRAVYSVTLQKRTCCTRSGS